MVTGGLGFIGSNLVNRLASRDDVARVIVVDACMNPAVSLADLVLRRSPKIEIQTVDIVDEETLLNIAKGCDVIFHLAAETHVQRSIVQPRPFVLTNMMGTFSILEVTRRLGCRLIHASTSEVYGEVMDDDIDENSPLRACSPYAATKLAADHLVFSYVETHNIEATIIRMFNAYGPGQHFEKVVPMFICSALCRLPLPIQGNGSAVRDWTYVDDVCVRLERLLTSKLPFVICNSGSGNAISVRHLAGHISKLAGVSDAEIVHFPERPGHVRHQTADVSRANQYLGQIRIPFDQGLVLTFNWYRDSIDRWRPLFVKIRTALLNEMQGWIGGVK